LPIPFVDVASVPLSSRERGDGTLKLIPPIVLLLVASAAAQSRQSSKPKTIQGSGCIEKAVESSCQVVTDAKTGELYNLLFSGKAPKNGTAIWFKGTEHQGMTTCMEGKPVNVKRWTKEKGIKCPPPARH
jgi:hypothetical protein